MQPQRLRDDAIKYRQPRQRQEREARLHRSGSPDLGPQPVLPFPVAAQLVQGVGHGVAGRVGGGEDEVGHLDADLGVRQRRCAQGFAQQDFARYVRGRHAAPVQRVDVSALTFLESREQLVQHALDERLLLLQRGGREDVRDALLPLTVLRGVLHLEQAEDLMQLVPGP